MDANIKNNLNNPYFFKSNRVWRLYTGGLLLDRFKNEKNEKDGHFPEEWLASTVKAHNGEHAQSKNEGIAQINNDNIEIQYFSALLLNHGEKILGEKHFQKFGPNAAILCKYLDSAVRLPIQCHPDEKIAKKLYSSSFGKTECWHIISTRKINGVTPYILLGFKRNLDPDAFKNAILEQNIDQIINMLHKIEVREGETYFVPARMPHAIGPGVFMLELQEPSDWVIQPEQYCSDIKLSQSDMWGRLTPDQGMEVFDYTGLELNELLSKVSPSNRIIRKSKNYEIQELIGENHTNSFSLWKVKLINKAEILLPSFAIIIVKQGNGYLNWHDQTRIINKSDYFFIPNSLNNLNFQSNDVMELLICLPPKN